MPTPEDLEEAVAGSAESPPRLPRRVRYGLIVAAGVAGALVLLYGADLLLDGDDVPRGRVVAGVGVGGMSIAEAETLLRNRFEPRSGGSVHLRAAEVAQVSRPGEVGLAVDWSATMATVGEREFDPFSSPNSTGEAPLRPRSPGTAEPIRRHLAGVLGNPVEAGPAARVGDQPHSEHANVRMGADDGGPSTNTAKEVT